MCGCVTWYPVGLLFDGFGFVVCFGATTVDQNRGGKVSRSKGLAIRGARDNHIPSVVVGSGGCLVVITTYPES